MTRADKIVAERTADLWTGELDEDGQEITTIITVRRSLVEDFGFDPDVELAPPDAYHLQSRLDDIVQVIADGLDEGSDIEQRVLWSILSGREEVDIEQWMGPRSTDEIDWIVAVYEKAYWEAKQERVRCATFLRSLGDEKMRRVLMAVGDHDQVAKMNSEQLRFHCIGAATPTDGQWLTREILHEFVHRFV